MRKHSAILIYILLFLVFFTIPCAASDNIIKINNLIEQSLSLDNTEVVIQGEVIGEALERGEYAWININDTTNAIGVWVKKNYIEQIQFYGDYKHKGDTVKITGVFYKSCTEHGGDVDIHCSNIEIVESGHEVKELISQNKLIITFFTLTISVVIITFYLKVKNK